MELVGPRLQDHVRDRAGAAPQIHGVVAGGDVHRLNCFERRDQDLQQAGALVVVDALDLVVIRHARGPVDFGLQRVRGVKELGVLLRRRRRAGHQGQQGLIIAVADQNRQFRHHHRVDVAAGIGAVRLQRRCGGGDFDGFRQAASLKLNVHALGGVHQQRNTLVLLFLKSGHLHRDQVIARGQIGKNKIAALIGFTDAADVGIGLGKRHLGAYHDRTCWIGNGSKHRRVDGLRVAHRGAQSAGI